MKHRLFFLAPLVLISLPTAAQPVVLGQYSMAYPFPSPDGMNVVFQGDFDGRWQLYTLTLDGGALQRLSTSPADDTHPAYAPDGRIVAFISNEPGNDDVYLLDVETGERRPLAPHPGKDGHPKWSADGEWIVFNRTVDPADIDGDTDAAILRVRPDGTDLEVLSDSDQIETFPSFSADGRFVVFVEWFPNAAGEPARNGELVKVEIATGVRTRLTDNDVFDAYPYWGGDWIYFTVFGTDAEGQRRAAVHRMSADGAVVEQVTAPGPIPDVRAIPNRDETQVFYNNQEDGRTVILMEALPTND